MIRRLLIRFYTWQITQDLKDATKMCVLKQR
jgi:hypothetical protein